MLAQCSTNDHHTAMPSKKAVTTYYLIKQVSVLSSAFAEQHTSQLLANIHTCLTINIV